MFFFFGQYRSGQVCEFVRNDPRHHTMPNLFPDRLGKRVVIDKVYPDCLWCYDDKPVTYKTSRSGRTIVDFDPRCVTDPCRPGDLRVIDVVPASRRVY